MGAIGAVLEWVTALKNKLYIGQLKLVSNLLNKSWALPSSAQFKKNCVGPISSQEDSLDSWSVRW